MEATLEQPKQKIAWEPFEKQVRALSCPAMEIHYGGAAGGGKSETLLMKALSIVRAPGARCLLLRRKIVDLQKLGALIDKSKNLYRGRGKYNDQKKRWSFPANASIEFGHCQAAKDLDNYYSAEYDFIGIDQVEQFTLDMYVFFFSRLRTTNPKIQPKIMSSSNPVGIGRAWIKERFWIDDRAHNRAYPITEEILFPNGNKRTLTYQRAFIPSKVFDNPHIIKNDPMYLLRLQQLPEEKRKALMDGDWNAFEGAFFGEFSKAMHVVDDFPIPQHWRRTIAFDWGYSDPSCVLWFAEDPASGRVYCYRLLKMQRTVDVDLMRMIYDLSKNEEIYCIFYPWDLDHIDGQTGVSKRERMSRVWQDLKGESPYMKVAPKERLEGWDAVRYLFAKRDDGLPRLQIFQSCKYLIESIPNQIHDDNNPEDLDTDGDDHACFVAGTKVMTETGYKNIEEIYIGEKVLTRNGFKKVVASGMTDSNAEVYLLRTFDGKSIIGTGNHPIFLEGGKKIPLSKLKQGDKLLDTRSLVLIQYGIWKLKSYLKQFKNLTDSVTGFAENISSALDCVCIGLFGNSMSVTFPMASIFTTRTGIGQTIRFQTSTVYEKRNTLRDITTLKKQNANGDSIWLSTLGQKQADGINQKLAANSTLSLESFHGKLESHGLKEIVISATGFTKRLSLYVLNFVISIAKLLTCVQNFSVTEVRLLPTKQSVFNLSVENTHEYVANGLLVSNCDALRYFALTYRNFFEKPEEKKEKVDPYKLPRDVGAAVKLPDGTYKFKPVQPPSNAFAWLGE